MKTLTEKIRTEERGEETEKMDQLNKEFQILREKLKWFNADNFFYRREQPATSGNVARIKYIAGDCGSGIHIFQCGIKRFPRKPFAIECLGYAPYCGGFHHLNASIPF